VGTSGEGVEFVPSGAELTIGAVAERSFSSRVFGPDLAPGVYSAAVTLAGATTLAQPIRLVAIRRGEALAYSLDLDGDDSPEWVLENQKIRAVFSARGGGRWLEFVWKETGTNLLPATGAYPGTGPVECRLENTQGAASLVIAGAGWLRTIRVNGAAAQVEFEQNPALPPESLSPRRAGDAALGVSRPSPARAVYSLDRLPTDSFDPHKTPPGLK
jgi:hypothetical protein